MPSFPRSLPSCDFRTISSTCGFIPTSHSRMPCSRFRFSASVSVFKAVYSRSGTPLMSIATTLGLYWSIKGFILFAIWPALAKKTPSLNSENQQTRKFLVIGVLLRTRPKDIGAPFAPEDVHGRISDLVGEGK